MFFLADNYGRNPRDGASGTDLVVVHDHPSEAANRRIYLHTTARTFTGHQRGRDFDMAIDSNRTRRHRVGYSRTSPKYPDQ